ncbi:MAG: lytic transglycosylase domain-containing protein [Bacteriovoracales bacterium]|nr:lytic transglycosylase domain-containing protein [Bacteriovoracales bacterium]
MRSLTRLLKKKNTVFSPYKGWIEDIIAVSKIKSIKKFKPCENVLEKDRKDALYKLLDKYCYLKFIKLYAYMPNKSFEVYGKHLEEYLPYYLFPLRREFITFLKRIKGRGSFERMVSDRVLKVYAREAQSFNVRILPHILITSDLTSYIQKTGLWDKESRSFYQKKMSALAKKIGAINSAQSLNRVQIEEELNKLIDISRRNINIINQNFARRLFIITGRKLLAGGRYPLAKHSFREALSLAAEENYNDSLFLYLWTDILNEKYTEVSKIINELDIHGKFENLDSRLKFWVAYTSEMTNKKRLAEHYYNSVLESHPMSFYAVMSIKRLKVISKKIKDEINVGAIINPVYASASIPLEEYSDNLITAFKRIKIFSELDQMDFVSHENHYIYRSPVRELLKNYSMYPVSSYEELKEKIVLHMVSILHEEQNFLKSFTIILKGIEAGRHDLNFDFLKALFPKPYMAEVKRLVGPKIDPYIIISLIRQESAFNPLARSRVGARGLMQLMPATARSMGRRISSGALNNAKTNLKVGIRYFIKLYKKYDRNLIYTLAAYNAGENRVKRWKREYFKNRSLLHDIEAIPFKETNLYVKLILRNLYFYKLIDGYKEDSEMVNKIFDVSIAKNVLSSS